ncbi:hypothetical protein KFL_007700070, partial [Klebsormidium nitens]
MALFLRPRLRARAERHINGVNSNRHVSPEARTVNVPCVKRHFGPVTQCGDKLTISVARTNRGSAGSDEVWFQRKSLGEEWRQLKELSGEEIGNLREKAEEERPGGRRKTIAAQAAVNRGRKVGETARSSTQEEGQLHTWNGKASGADDRRTVVDQAVMYLDGLRRGESAFYSVGKQGSTSTVYLASTWNHNAARPKPLGRPSKVRALLEKVHRDTMGNLSCTCDRGRLYSQAPCVHKLTLQALESPRLASAILLQKGPRVVEIPCDMVRERVFGVYWNAGSPSPQRTMVHYGEEAQMGWYCEGRKSGGCSKTADCSHIQGVKRALSGPSAVIVTRVVEIPCDRVGERFFGVYWNAGSPSPQRTMVHYGEGAQMGWYCEGQKSGGCSKTADCSHIQGVKRALSGPSGVEKLSRTSFSEEQLELAKRSLKDSLEDSRGGDGGVKRALSGPSGVEKLSTSSFSEEQLELAKTSLKDGLGDSRGSDGVAHSGQCAPDADVDGYLAELVVGSHERAACEGPSCFCKQHPRVFGGADVDEEPCAARCCESAQTNGKRARSEQAESSGGVGEASARSGKRRTKSYWAAKGIETEASNAATGNAGEAESESAEERGRGADSPPKVDDRNAFSIPVCNICVCPSNVCTHGASHGVATVLPMEAEGVQLEVPKLVRPTDSWQVHDPEVSLLRRPVRVSELTARDFEELSAAESLSAPCPRGPPPCRTRWLGLWQSAHVYD